MSNAIPKVTIIILHFDNVRLLAECLKSCQNVKYPNYEIIIVQNGLKSELSLSSMRRISEHVSEIINLPENVGYARANNLGIIKALDHGADYILLLNDDMVVSPKTHMHTLTQGVEVFYEYTKDAFESEFSQVFEIQSAEPLKNFQRILYLMKKR